MNEAPATIQPVLTLAEVADLLRVSGRTVARLTERGILRPLPLGGRLVRYAADDVHSLISGGSAKPHGSHLRAWHERAAAGTANRIAAGDSTIQSNYEARP